MGYIFCTLISKVLKIVLEVTVSLSTLHPSIWMPVDEEVIESLVVPKRWTISGCQAPRTMLGK